MRAVAQARIDWWAREAQRGGRTLGYKQKRDSETVGLLKSPGPLPWDDGTAPTSMREVEPTVSLILGGLTGTDTLQWEAATSSGGDAESDGEDA